jgi:hypothetical protein
VVAVSLKKTPRIRVVSAAYALNADHLDGNSASYFLDTSSGVQNKGGPLIVDAIGQTGQYGVRGYGEEGGGYFESVGGYGVEARGWLAAGYFEHTTGDGRVDLGWGNTGIRAKGSTEAGFFVDTDLTSSVRVASGNVGVKAYGQSWGGEFRDLDERSRAYVADGENGIWAIGEWAGGYFQDSTDSSRAHISNGEYGVYAYAPLAGGYFLDWGDSGYAFVGNGDFGIKGYGNEAGGYFEDLDGSSVVWVGRNDNGISSYGDMMGGYFEDNTSGTYVRVAYETQAIDSNATMAFVQNHPYEKDKVIVYSSLDGDEVGTYTRGTARLENGVARVTLGETFRWVTNPDVGLTVHLTPQEDCNGLFVESKSTRDLVVRELNGGTSDAVFDYVVHGLRIGFEQVAQVREKDGEARIPSMASLRERYERRPALRRYNALERFVAMAASVRGVSSSEVDLSRSAELTAAIQEHDPKVHGDLSQDRPDDPASIERPGAHDELSRHGVRPGSAPGTGSDSDLSRHHPNTTPKVHNAAVRGPTPTSVASEQERAEPLPTGATLLPVHEPVEPGDLLALDSLDPDRLRRAAAIADPAVIGVVAGKPVEQDGVLLAPVVGAGFTVVKVDATYGAVRAGDVLTSSPTAGHAMTTLAPAPGTVIGKALETLDDGTGLIRVLVMPR